MLSSNSPASITISSGAGPKPEPETEMRVRAAASARSGFANAGSMTTGRYGEDQRPNLPAAALATLLTVGLFAALLHTGYHRAQAEAAKLAVVNLSIAPPPPPPPAPPKETPPQQ